jgi:transposase-like protein
MPLKLLEKQEETKPPNSREITKIRAETYEIRIKETIQRINETKIWFFEKINKINKPLAKVTKCRRNKAQINEIRGE